MTANTVTLSIDGTEVAVAARSTLVEAAAALGITIPTLCHLPGHPPWGSCMVCVVQDTASGRLLPACAARAEAGMQIATTGEAVQRSRRQALELLLSEHLGDCAAPCQSACPAEVRVAAALRHVELNNPRRAAVLLREDLGMPSLVCALCPAPCESACRRGALDVRLAVRSVWRQVLAVHHPEPDPVAWPAAPVAVVGAGPSGLLTAAHLRRLGYPVVVVHSSDRPGGSLWREVETGTLDEKVLHASVTELAAKGVAFMSATTVGAGLTWHRLAAQHAAVVAATGPIDDPPPTDGSVVVAAAASRPGKRRIAQVAADARAAAYAVHHALRGLRAEAATNPRFRSHSGRLDRSEIANLAEGRGSVHHIAGTAADLPAASLESARCLQCGCFSADSCELRRLAEAHGVDPRRYRAGERPPLQRSSLVAPLVHEPGKCIRCGRCVRLATEAGAPAGMAFVGRGAAMRVMPPFEDSVAAALGIAAARCVEACPTGALCAESNGKHR